jgi:hypothetical protein
MNEDSITQPDVGGQASTNFSTYSRSAARKIIQDLNNETRLGPKKSALLGAVRQELLTEHLSAEKLSDLYVLGKLSCRCRC